MKKLLTSTFLALALLTMSVMPAFAQDTTTITGTVQSVELGTDASGATVVTVTLLDDQGATQTLTLSLETATSLGLVVTDADGVTTVSPDAVDSSITVDTADVIAEDEKAQHPVGSALSDFFSSLLGVNYDTLMAYHNDGVGFGVIAQALWLTNSVDGNTDTFTALLDAKMSGDYSGITLADGSTPRNWGDVVKSLKKGDNLGKVMSGKETASNGQNNGNGKPDDPGNGHAKPEDPSNGHGNGKPENPGNGHGNGKP